VDSSQRSRHRMFGSSLIHPFSCGQVLRLALGQSTPNKKDGAVGSIQAAPCNENDWKDLWLRGMDLNHRPLGYDRADLWLCS
jgi:hypothetical protein